jgi:SAM-dependent methyltransferase
MRSPLKAATSGYWSFDSRTWDDLLADEEFRGHLGEMTDWLASVLPEGGEVADLGCGTGNYALALGGKGYRVLGLDFARGALARAEEKRSRLGVDWVRFEEADLTKPLPMADGSVDGALAMYVVQVVGNPAPFFEEVARVVRPSGHLLLEAPGPGFRSRLGGVKAPFSHRLFFLVKQLLMAVDLRIGLIQFRSAAELGSMLEAAGFDVVEDRSDGGVVALLARRAPA